MKSEGLVILRLEKKKTASWPESKIRRYEVNLEKEKRHFFKTGKELRINGK